MSTIYTNFDASDLTCSKTSRQKLTPVADRFHNFSGRTIFLKTVRKKNNLFYLFREYRLPVTCFARLDPCFTLHMRRRWVTRLVPSDAGLPILVRNGLMCHVACFARIVIGSMLRARLSSIIKVGAVCFSYFYFRKATLTYQV